jgi:hypothetical protein
MENQNGSSTIDSNKIVMIIALFVVAILAYVVWMQQKAINALALNSNQSSARKSIVNPNLNEREKIGFKYSPKEDTKSDI